MHKIFAVLLLLLATVAASAQPSQVFVSPELKFNEAKTFAERGDYAFAYPLINELKNEQDLKPPLYSYLKDDVDFYYLFLSLQLHKPLAAGLSTKYIGEDASGARRQLLAFHLAHYYFVNKEYGEAIKFYQLADSKVLSNDQLAQAKFEKAYAYFAQNNFAAAKPLFNEIHQIPANKYYLSANYYYGYIAYSDREFAEALQAFSVVEKNDEFKGVAPYYIADIYYQQGKKDEALRYGTAALENGLQPYYRTQLELLIGHLYFEKKDYARVLPLLENYVKVSAKVSKETMYELNYSYYQTGRYADAIDGFKQLSNEKDSLGQNSMYLLGDLLLKASNKPEARNAFLYSAQNNSNATLQEVSRFQYAKLSYELGYQDVALRELRFFTETYPASKYDVEAKSLLINLLANTSNYIEAEKVYESIRNVPASLSGVYAKILFGRAMDFVNDQDLINAEQYLNKILVNATSGAISNYARFWKGEIALRQQRFGDAIRLLNSFITSGAAPLGEANLNNARYNLGYAYLQRQEFAQAYTQFSSLTNGVNVNSSSLVQDAYLRSADALFMQRSFDAADVIYNKIIAWEWLQADYAYYQHATIVGVKNSAEKIRLLSNIGTRYPRTTLASDADMEIAAAYMADQKFSSAIPFLQKLIQNGSEQAKPQAYLKLGQAYYNADNNKQALSTFQTLLNKYPQSQEAAEALPVIKDIYVEDGNAAGYLTLMQSLGKDVDRREADSLSYNSAIKKWDINNCNASLESLEKYIASFHDGMYVTDAHYFKAQCYQNQSDNKNAIRALNYVVSKGVGKYYVAAALQAGRINYFENKWYKEAKDNFTMAYAQATNQADKLEALRGLVRSTYQLQDYTGAVNISNDLLAQKGISADDKAIASLVLGKSLQAAGDCAGAIKAFTAVATANKSAWGAEARYEIAACHFSSKNYTASENAAMKVIKETGSYDFWVTKSYLLLGDIFMAQKDYFNAKATYESVSKNASVAELKSLAAQKLQQAIDEEKKYSKIGNP